LKARLWHPRIFYVPTSSLQRITSFYRAQPVNGLYAPRWPPHVGAAKFALIEGRAGTKTRRAGASRPALVVPRRLSAVNVSTPIAREKYAEKRMRARGIRDQARRPVIGPSLSKYELLIYTADAKVLLQLRLAVCAQTTACSRHASPSRAEPRSRCLRSSLLTSLNVSHLASLRTNLSCNEHR
jgi:hypothetical protein